MTDFIEQLAALAEKATPGPWRFEIDRCHFDSAAVVASDGFIGANYYRRDADAHLVVALLNSIPAILALGRERDALQGQIDQLANYIMNEVEGEPSQNQGAVETAIRIIRQTLEGDNQ